MELRYIPLMNYALSQNTKDYIEHGNLDLRILAILIRDTLSEAKKEEQIDKILEDIGTVYHEIFINCEEYEVL